MTCSEIYPLINTRQWIAILGASLVQISEVYTHSPFAIYLLNHYHIGKPIQIMDFSNKLCCNQLLDHILNSIVSLGGEYSFLLLHKFRGGTYIQAVGYDFRIYTWRILMTPSKHINVLFQKTDEVLLNLLF